MSLSKAVKGSQNYVWFGDQRLGKGAMGTVFIARHRRKGTKSAAKVFNPNSKMTEFIQRELHILRQMTDHQHIVKLIAIEEETYSKESVVILELCEGGSLQRVLDEPENYYGLAHDEWLVVFSHTVKALRHLHDHSIVHRDIKPGNILLQITADGRHIYKLTDFGAAKILTEEDDGSFKSLCGTEEYLHPALHSSAFVRRIPGQLYGHSVDIWSFGVTMYQVATGKLPFRPKDGIRQDRQMMNALMTQKPRGVIARYQRPDGGIENVTQLPRTSRIMAGTRNDVERILSGIFDLDEPWNVSNFYRAMCDFCDKTPLYLYSLDFNDMLCIHLEGDASLKQLRDEISGQTGVAPSEQLLLTRDGPLAGIVSATERIQHYPTTSPEQPIYVMSRKFSLHGGTPRNDELPSLPDPIAGVSPLVADAKWAAEVCGNIYHYQYTTVILISIQTHLLILRTALYDMLNDLCRTTENSIWKQRQMKESLVKLWDKVRRHLHIYHKHPRHRDSIRTKAADVESRVESCRREHHRLFTQYETIQDKIRQYSMLTGRSLKPSCVSQDRCKEKGDVLIKEALPMYTCIIEDKSRGELSHNDMEIHKYNKSGMKRTHRRLRENVAQHCVQHAQLQYEESSEICSSMLQTMETLKILEPSVVSFNKTLEKCENTILEVISLDFTEATPEVDINDDDFTKPDSSHCSHCSRCQASKPASIKSDGAHSGHSSNGYSVTATLSKISSPRDNDEKEHLIHMNDTFRLPEELREQFSKLGPNTTSFYLSSVNMPGGTGTNSTRDHTRAPRSSERGGGTSRFRGRSVPDTSLLDPTRPQSSSGSHVPEDPDVS